MLSQEFMSTVENKNLLRTRIMLKDSLIVDPTFTQLNEMLAYAKKMLPDLMVQFDEGYLEEDQTKWNQEVMDLELVHLISNFSDTRIDHLKKVVSKVLASKITQAKMQQAHCQSPRQQSQSRAEYGSNTSHSCKNTSKRKEELEREIMTEGTKISKIIQTGRLPQRQQMNELQEAASQLFRAIKEYKENR